MSPSMDATQFIEDAAIMLDDITAAPHQPTLYFHGHPLTSLGGIVLATPETLAAFAAEDAANAALAEYNQSFGGQP